jgi:hypothetical protein
LKARIYAVAGIIGIFVYGITKAFGSVDSFLCRVIMALSMMAVYASLASGLIYTSSRLQTLQRKIKSKLRKNLLLVILTLVIGIVLLFTLIPMLMIGSAG